MKPSRALKLFVSAVGLRRIPNQNEAMATVASVWGEQAGAWKIGGVRHWTELLQIQHIINSRVSGEPQVDPYMYFLRRYLKDQLPIESALTIGCGGGDLERGLSQYSFTKRHDAFDLAPGAIGKAIAAAEAAGIDNIYYSVADANRLELEPQSYDVVFGVQSIHHVENLEELFREVARALRPDGFLFLNEFVGPSRFQWDDRQLEVVNGLLRVIPEELRRTDLQGSFKCEVVRPTLDDMITIDPSEAVRSGEILESVRANFDILEIRPYGGTVLQLVLDDIAGNFANPGGTENRLLSAIADVEWALIDSGVLRSDFVVVIAKPKR